MISAHERRRGTYVLLGLALLIVQPIIFTVVRTLMGAYRFDGLSILSILVMLVGALLIRVHASQDGR